MSSSVIATAREEIQESFSFGATTDAEHEQHSSSAALSPEQNVNSLTAPQGNCLKLKGSLVPMTVLELSYFRNEKFDEELQAKIKQAPDFFENLPVVIDLTKYVEPGLPFEALLDSCQQHSIKVVAIRGGSDELQLAAKRAGLSLLAAQKERASAPAAEEVVEEVVVAPTLPSKDNENAPETGAEQATNNEAPIVKERQVSKVVHHPIRSGQQVYASDGDLIVMASVSAGAEILADGNIHVYGALRGRALAGVKGDSSARIFCHSLDAELVSVAGQYKISEDIGAEISGKPAQVYLEGSTLRLKEIEL
ncbi:MAG: septum site-determining protein MinC [Oleiphilaceae bacterium]|nr:septum site-determining protein MinC [Oleiphilaceae bacterium]